LSVKICDTFLPEHLNIAVFASGKGSNLQAILDAINIGKIPNANVILVISNNSDSGALKIAEENSIPSLHLSQKQFESDKTFNNTLLETLSRHKANFIALAGYMKKLDSCIINAFRNRIINIHPALLPAFGGKGMYGMHVHKAVIASGVKVSGATVHIVDDLYDHGPIVLQKKVEILQSDTPETLAERVLAIEHEIYTQVIRLFAENRVQVRNQQIIILD
jgi:phosphoribosylglycinamide formyltransferase 1